MNILITICARGGSKGIPGKNIKELNGKPLIGYTIDTAKRFAEQHPATNIVLSTDSDQIKRVAAQCGLQSDYTRPDFLASDTAGKVDAIYDVVKFYQDRHRVKYDCVLDMDVTSPLRNVEDLEKAFELLIANPEANNIYSVSPCNRNPYFNMVERHDDGYYRVVKKLDANFLTRQSSPEVYDLNASFYFYRAKFFEQEHKSAHTDKTLVYVVPHQCFDLDHQIDFDFLEYLIVNNKLDFEL